MLKVIKYIFIKLLITVIFNKKNRTIKKVRFFLFLFRMPIKLGGIYFFDK